ncbi:MAG: hypothetical protein HYY84_00890 [Deltaproteobacteria bacterium]|nr:hypothetical protein [Deltaproteobacteria bacterium]
MRPVRPPPSLPCETVARLKLESGKQVEVPVALSPSQYIEIVIRGVVLVGSGTVKIDARRVYRDAKPTEHRLLALWPPQFRLFISGGAEKHEYVFGRVDARALSGKPVRALFDIAPLKAELQDVSQSTGALVGELRRCETGQAIPSGPAQTAVPIVPLVIVGASTLSLGAVGFFVITARRRRQRATKETSPGLTSGPLTSDYAIQLEERLRTAFDAALDAAEGRAGAATTLSGSLATLYDATRGLLGRIDRLAALEASIDEAGAATDGALGERLRATRHELAQYRIRAEKIERVFNETATKISAAADEGSGAPIDVDALTKELSVEIRAIETLVTPAQGQPSR